MCTLRHFRKKSAMAAISITNDMTDEEVAAHFSGLHSFNVPLKYDYHVCW